MSGLGMGARRGRLLSRATRRRTIGIAVAQGLDLVVRHAVPLGWRAETWEVRHVNRVHVIVAQWDL
jgi:hypothetical protein